MEYVFIFKKNTYQYVYISWGNIWISTNCMYFSNLKYLNYSCPKSVDRAHLVILVKNSVKSNERKRLRTEMWLLQTKYSRGHMWNMLSITVYQWPWWRPWNLITSNSVGLLAFVLEATWYQINPNENHKFRNNVST